MSERGRWRRWWLSGMVCLALALSACGPNLALLDSSTGLYINAIIFGGATGYAAGTEPGQHQTVLLSNQSGTWALDANQPPVTRGDEIRALALDGATLWVAGMNSDAQHGQNVALTGFACWRGADGVWHRVKFDQLINTITFAAPGDGWAAGGNGAIYHLVAGVWTAVPDAMTDEVKGIAFRSATDGWLVGVMGAIAHYDGATWTYIPHLTHTDLLAITLTAADGWAVATGGEIFRLQRGQWLGVAAPITTDNRAVVTAGDTVYVAGDHGAVFIRDNATAAWSHTPQPADTQLNALALAPDGTLWAGGFGSAPALYAYRDGGWQIVTIALK